MAGPEIIIATSNEGKVREIRQICADLTVAPTSLKDHWRPVPDIPETGETFLENARIKAEWVWERRATWVLADDSGLEIDSLGGKPGVWSSRYAGEHAHDRENIAKVLEELKGVPPEKRTARFKCVMVLLSPSGEASTAEGVCEGRILSEPRGEGGFGYDPIFVPEGYTGSFAELDADTKNGISHRGRALESLKGRLHELFD
ncbi:MAG: XTP/dITP diphosphatase [Chitinivibrionales bacterium]|nr:XTP/dITP diphosphatase [Chitinivibrionales bacterium]MBD3358454.1 XTP/dITP diphosphatase [Chitinivibrionales bacterium]